MLERTQVDVTERAATNLAADSVLVADTEILDNSVSLTCYLQVHVHVDIGTASGVEAYHCRHCCCGFNLEKAGL
jgi:hypothetical protein